MESTKNYNQEWASIFLKEETISVQKLIPGNFYKILVYKYADGKVKTLAGSNVTYIFLIGRYIKDKNEHIAAIKLKTVDPKYFFDDIKSVFNPNPVTIKKIEEVYENKKSRQNNEFSKLLKSISKDGKNIFSVIKTKKRIYSGYREYILKNIKNAYYVDINPDFLKVAVTKNSKKIQNIEKKEKMTNIRNAETNKISNKK